MKAIQMDSENKQISFQIGDKVQVRKIKEADGLKLVTYKGDTYFYESSFQMGYGSSSNLIKITQEMKDYENKFGSKSWTSLKNMLEEIVEKYQFLTTETTSVPSGPDTSKFRATKSGFIRVLAKPDNFGVSSYTSGTYIHAGIQIGGNVSGEKELVNLITYLMMKFAPRLKYGNSDNKLRFVSSWGTNFSTYGVG